MSVKQLSPSRMIRERGRQWEIGPCYMDKESIMENGESTIVVVRKHKGGRFSVGVYLLDTYCLGVKDAFYRVLIDREELNDLLDRFRGVANMEEVPYVEAHNWIFGAVEFAREAGIEPHRDFAVAKYLLEDDEDENIPIIEYPFGRDGKHLLICDTLAEASRYLSILDKNLGRDNYGFIVREFSEKMMEMAEKMNRFPSTEYTYKHPEYPAIYQPCSNFFKIIPVPDEPGNCPSKKTLKKLLSGDRESLRLDLQNYILFETGMTCESISEERMDNYTPAMFYAIALLGEVGTEESLDVILETLRQKPDYYECHFGDSDIDLYPPVLYKLGRNHIEKLKAFLKEPGLHSFAKGLIFTAITVLLYHEPDRRTEVLDFYKDILSTYTVALPKGEEICDAHLAGSLVCELLDIRAIELKPEIEALFATGKVDDSICGDLKDVLDELNGKPFPSRLTYETDPVKIILDFDKKRWE